MSLSEKLAQAAAARVRREASESADDADAARSEALADEATDARRRYAVRFEDVTIDLTSDVAAVRANSATRSESELAAADGTVIEAEAETGGAPTADGDMSPAPASQPTHRAVTIDELKRRRAARDELKRRRAARFEMRPAAPNPFDAVAPSPLDPVRLPPPPLRSEVAPVAPGFAEERRQALLDRLADLRVEQYVTDDGSSGPASLAALPSGERVGELLRRRVANAIAPAVEIDRSADEPVPLESPPTSDPFAALRPTTSHFPQPRPARLRFRRNRGDATQRQPAAPAAQAPIPGPRCSTCGGPARIDIVDRASHRRHLSCVCCGRLWEERLEA